MPTFFEMHREMQELAREWNIVRQHNLRCAAENTLGRLLLLSEGLLVLTMFERFFRIIVPNPQDRETLPNLMERAVALGLIKMQREDIQRICRVRNQVVHANYEQAATASGQATPGEYFGSSRYIKTVEELTLSLDGLIAQIDPINGRPYNV